LLDCVEIDGSVVIKSSKKGDPMRSFNAKYNLSILFLSTFLIVQTMVGVPPQELYTESGQTYVIVYFISFFLGAVLCALIHKYYLRQPIASQETPTSDQKNF
jgi:hypothetical protein